MNEQDYKMKELLTFLSKKQCCTQEQIHLLWNQWQNRSESSLHPLQFLAQHKIPITVLKEHMMKSTSHRDIDSQARKSSTAEVKTESSEIEEINRLVLEQIRAKNLVSEDQLQKYHQECNQKGLHLGQTLVKKSAFDNVRYDHHYAGYKRKFYFFFKSRKSVR